MRMVAWVEGRKSRILQVYGRILLSIRPYTPKYTARILLQYFEYTDYARLCSP